MYNVQKVYDNQSIPIFHSCQYYSLRCLTVLRTTKCKNRTITKTSAHLEVQFYDNLKSYCFGK